MPLQSILSGFIFLYLFFGNRCYNEGSLFKIAYSIVDFEIISDITNIEIIATGTGIRNRERLQKQYGKGKWRKLKGIAQVQLPNGIVRLAEVHCYEAHGIGKKEFKLKLPFLD
jgi:hypothetical protein